MKLIFSRAKILACVVLAVIAFGLHAQTRSGTIKVTGTVADALGEAGIGAAVMAPADTASGCIYDMDGKFAVEAASGTELLVSGVGYAAHKEATLTGAVSSVLSRDVVIAKDENVQNILTGKVAGLRVVQNSAEPGAFRCVASVLLLLSRAVRRECGMNL